MKNLFRSRFSHHLTLSQITELSNQSNLSPGEIERWYERFLLCFTNGYISFGDFLIYTKQLNISHGNQQNQLSKSIIKQLFCILDSDKDKQLNFVEFFRFNLLINQGSAQDKLKFIFNLHDRQKQIYYTQQEIVNILLDMFGLLNLPKPTDNLFERVDKILTYLNLHNQNSKICWNTFCISILNHSTLYELLLSNNFDSVNFEETLICQF